jgi:hypothetical protein
VIESPLNPAIPKYEYVCPTWTILIRHSRGLMGVDIFVVGFILFISITSRSVATQISQAFCANDGDIYVSARFNPCIH